MHDAKNIFLKQRWEMFPWRPTFRNRDFGTERFSAPFWFACYISCFVIVNSIAYLFSSLYYCSFLFSLLVPFTSFVFFLMTHYPCFGHCMCPPNAMYKLQHGGPCSPARTQVTWQPSLTGNASVDEIASSKLTAGLATQTNLGILQARPRY